MAEDRDGTGGHSPPEHQRRVDEMMAEARREGAAARPSIIRPPPPRPSPSPNLLDQRVSEEMDLIVRQLEHLGGILADDPILLMRHSAQLQAIDLMKQTLGHLARIVAAEDKTWAADLVTLTELKARLQRKALRPLGPEDPPA